MEVPPVYACPWPPAPDEVSIPEDELHLWCTSLDLAAWRIDELRRTLCEEEQRRAARFRLGRLRDHFIAARGTLRTVLARYVGTEPAALRFEYQYHGKPVLASDGGPRRLHFNLSHSHGVAVIAVAGRELGVDVEWVRPRDSAGQLVQRFFSEDEKRQWEQLPAEFQPLAFFHGWTRKEAWLKAVGSGLTFPLSEFCVSMMPGEPARVLSICGNESDAAVWWLDSCVPSPHYVAATAIRGQPAVIRRWQCGY